jgi:hypothetical protein
MDKWKELLQMDHCSKTDLDVAKGFLERQKQRENLYEIKDRLQKVSDEWVHKSYDL